MALRCHHIVGLLKLMHLEERKLQMILQNKNKLIKSLSKRSLLVKMRIKNGNLSKGHCTCRVKLESDGDAHKLLHHIILMIINKT